MSYDLATIINWELLVSDEDFWPPEKMKCLESLQAFARSLCFGGEADLPKGFIFRGMAKMHKESADYAEIEFSQMKIKINGDYDCRMIRRRDGSKEIQDPVCDGHYIIITGTGERYCTKICHATMETQLLLTALLLIQ